MDFEMDPSLRLASRRHRAPSCAVRGSPRCHARLSLRMVIPAGVVSARDGNRWMQPSHPPPTSFRLVTAAGFRAWKGSGIELGREMTKRERSRDPGLLL